MDSGGSKYTGTVYKKGGTKTVYAYLPVSGSVYKAGTPVNKIGYAHSSGTLYYGNGSSGYLRGSSVSAVTGYTQYQGALYDADGERVNSSGNPFYYNFSRTTLYRGDGGYITGRGSAVDAIEWNGTLYEKGASVTPIGTKVSGVYQRNAEDDQTFDTIGGACSLKLATLTTREITALTV